MKRFDWYIIAASFVLFGVLLIVYSLEHILVVQRFISVSIPTLVFWVAALALSVKLTSLDIGYMKIGTILGMIVTLYAIVYGFVMTSDEYIHIRNEEYVLVIKIEETEGTNYRYNVYKKDTIMTSSYVGFFLLGPHYESTFEIVGDELIITKCTDVTCQEDVFQIE